MNSSPIPKLRDDHDTVIGWRVIVSVGGPLLAVIAFVLLVVGALVQYYLADQRRQAEIGSMIEKSIRADINDIRAELLGLSRQLDKRREDDMRGMMRLIRDVEQGLAVLRTDYQASIDTMSGNDELLIRSIREHSEHLTQSRIRIGVLENERGIVVRQESSGVGGSP